MSPMKNSMNNYSSNAGEDAVRTANVLASCYLVDAAGSLKGLHYCTTGATGLPSPPSSPPLAAITPSNELALLPKSKKRSSSNAHGTTKKSSRRGGAAFVIREECERFFCERMSNVFHHGEGNTTSNASRLMGASTMPTPPPDSELQLRFGQDGLSDPRAVVPAGSSVTAWLEFWDFAGGASFYAFVADDMREKSLFVFFDHNVVGTDLKKALMALIELGDGPLDCQHLVVCIDRRIREGDTKGLMKSLQWVGFELTTLDHWAHGLDVTSKEWLFMGMEL